MNKQKIIYRFLFILTAVVALVADQVSKMWVDRMLELGQSLPPDGWIRLTYIRNTGVAFGLFPNQTFVVTLAALVGLALLLIYYRFSPFQNLYTYTALGFILGGSSGNILDRLRLGYVIDFIDFRVWPIFNLGDSAVVLGTGIMAYFFLFKYKARDGRQQTVDRKQ